MKYVLVLCDGMADFKIDKLGGKTPLEAAYKPNIGVFLLQCHHDFGGIGVNTVRHSAEKIPLALGVCADYLALKPLLQRSAARIAFVIPPCKPIGPVAGKGDGIFTRYVKLGRLKLHYSPSVV